ncbi:MAG: hypothetical protein K9I69_08400 [Ignavibacteriales bacterium]|nr:hypothetical protein [Ignavibacteriales bacterium]MCF8304896.1 hypothetical protein [Ignavibacteriales bacterium]MCF8314585.1 hypothetical protein [Ignavibacteriales bacterium]MCF8436378.1 hypothetical protein [Ignavibacteriales bacterium]
MKKAKIEIFVNLDDNNIPESIEWSSTDAGFPGTKQADSMLLSFWDKEEKNTMSLDLWTTSMLVPDMKMHIYQQIMGLAEICKNATGDQNLMGILLDCAGKISEEEKFGHKH